MRKPTMREWICTNCGKKTRVSISIGRAVPGTCPRSLRKGGAHRWVKNRDL